MTFARQSTRIKSDKKLAKMAILAALPALMLAGCKVSSDGDDKAAEPPTTATSTATDTQVPIAAAAFDIGSLPVSTVPLGAFPFFTLPAGYEIFEMDTGTKDYARFPFWVKGKEIWVEGKMYQGGFESEPGKQFSIFEVAKNLDNAVTQLGGQKISEEEIPSDVRKAWTSEIKAGFYYPHYQAMSNPSHVWAIRRNDGNIWVFLAGGDKMGGFVIAQEAPLTQTSSLIPASDLKKAIDTSGKVSLQVNFATDKTDILPDSLPQIDQVVKLLSDDPALKLAINGHTDNTGDKAHNQQLSEGRAKSVVSALTAKGVAADRLTAKGYGDTQPVADNGTEEGKAKNRRVELVKA